MLPDDAYSFGFQQNKCLNKEVEWQIFRNFIVNNQRVMKQIKPLDQVIPIEAYAHNHTAKVANKFGSQDSILYNLKEFSSSVPDFRRTDKGNIRHRLDDIIMLMIFARASKCVGRAEIMEFGRHNLKKFRQLGMLKNGVPSEATLHRVERGIDELALADRMQGFAEAFRRRLYGAEGDREIICVDGKAERGTVLDNGRSPDIVSAYSYNTGITLATEACREKSNEIKAIPRLIDKIDISGENSHGRRHVHAEVHNRQDQRERGRFPYRAEGEPAVPALRRGRQAQGTRSRVFIHGRAGTRARQNRNQDLSCL